jgi:hypothetical protein
MSTGPSSIYKRYASGEVVKLKDFDLTMENVHQYHKMCAAFHEEITRNKRWCELKYKLLHPEEHDQSLYTPEYIKRRIEKLESERLLDETSEKHLRIFQDMMTTKKSTDVIRPLVFDLEKGKDVSLHEQMSNLNDRRKELEDEMVELYKARYPLLCRNVSKIFYLILESCDISVVDRCFRGIVDVLKGESSETACKNMSREFQNKYGLPKGYYDPLFGTTTSTRLNRRQRRLKNKIDG